MRSSEEKKKGAAGEAGAQGKGGSEVLRDKKKSSTLGSEMTTEGKKSNTAGAEAATDGKKRGSRKKTYLTRAAGVAILLTVILCVNYAASICFDSIHGADYYNYDIDRLEKEHANVEMVVVGASQVYHACNPDVISEEMGIDEVIDCSSASANNDGQYFMLRDLLRRFDPKYVVIDMSWRKFLDKGEKFTNRGKLLMADRLKWPDKLDYARHCFNVEQTLNLLLPMYRFGGNIWGTSQLKLHYKDRMAVQSGNWIDESERNYRKNGFCWYNRGVKPGGIPAEVNYYSDDLIMEYEKSWVEKMWELCKEQGIQVVFTTLPTSMEELFSIENYQASADYMEAFAAERGCQYLNYNLLKDRDKILPDTMFTDELHLTGEGSIVFSRIFSKHVIMALNGEDTSEFFYNNIDELKKEVQRVVACNAKTKSDGKGNLVVEAISLHNDDIVPEYRLLVASEKDLRSHHEDVEGSGGDDRPDNNEEPGSDDDISGGDEDSGDDEDSGGAEAENGGEDGNGGDGAQAGNDAGDGAQAGADSEDSDVGTEIRPWQDEPTFVVSQSEIPAGCFLRVEAREKGQTEEYAFANRLTSWYRKL